MNNSLIDKKIDDSIISEIPEILPVLPLRDNVIFPYMIFPVLVGREQSINAANFALKSTKYIFITTQKDPSIDEPKQKNLYKEGTVAKVIQVLKLPNGLLKVLVDGLIQARIKNFTDEINFFEAEIELARTIEYDEGRVSALIRQLSDEFKKYVSINKTVPTEALATYKNIPEPDRKLYFVAANLVQPLDVKQSILQIFNLEEQIFELIRILKSEIEILKIEKEIESKVQENISKAQRKFIIQEQIRILNEELGDESENGSEFSKLEEKIKKAKMPKTIETKCLEELNKLKRIPQSSPESTVLRNYVDWMINIPWSKKSKDILDIENVRKILDEDHFGLDKPKERIVEHIAVLNLVKQMRGQIICLVGPPGVGKTSLGKSIARSLNRKFVRISLGGIKDEAEIRGHRRTYIGSMPGKIIQAMKRAGTINPVILLDEIDKMSADFRGDPSSAMLEVLDPEQNHTFNDHYLDVDYDLSQVMFITTANVKYNIPLPLLDRMELIELPGYLEHEKIEIAKRHVIPKQLEAHGLKSSLVKFSDEAIRKTINEYTKESGVRNMEREIASICRKTAKKIVSRKPKNKKINKIQITPAIVEKYLGVPKFANFKRHSEPQIGNVTGLAWTSVGGEILNVETTIMKGPEKLTLTGQLGDVMKESAIAALSYLRSNQQRLKISATAFKGKEIHIHLPEGAIPKDGPSAGITLTMSLYSALTAKPARNDIAMTGEITLRGNVLAIGGLTEKLLAAKRNGIKTILIPKENAKDLPEIPHKVLDELEIIQIENIDEALKITFPIKAKQKNSKKNTSKVKNTGKQKNRETK